MLPITLMSTICLWINVLLTVVIEGNANQEGVPAITATMGTIANIKIVITPWSMLILIQLARKCQCIAVSMEYVLMANVNVKMNTQAQIAQSDFAEITVQILTMKQQMNGT